jgi:hypothetical protein
LWELKGYIDNSVWEIGEDIVSLFTRSEILV